MLWNFYFDLTDGVKIQKLVVNVYFGNNLIMVTLLKTRIECPSLIALSQLKLNLVTAQKILYARSLSLYEQTKSINLENLEGMDFNTIDSF